MNNLYSIVSFDGNDNWIVIAEAKIGNQNYSYLAKLNEKKDDIIEEYKAVKSEFSLDGEYMEDVTDEDELKKVLPILLPDVKEYIENPDKIKDLLEIN